MADDLKFPIGFDLAAAVDGAIKQWNSKEADRLEKAIQKRALEVKLKLNTKSLDNLDDVRRRLAQLKIEPITPETKSAIKELARELQQLAKALEAVQKYSKNPTKGAVDTSKVQLNEQRVKAQAALAAQRAAKAEDNLAAASLKAARAANVGIAATRNANKAYAEQHSYLKRLTQRMAAYWSARQVGNFIANVREVTAQFELQRVSLGAILQDQNKANQLFSEIKSFALKSPVKVLDLTKYTKQLAAYKIGYDELFETTKKLTDVSVGLGVSMDRVVLAYGQVRARGALYSSEIRQFTEMGVPIVEELAAKLTKMNGELVTSAQVLDLVQKGAISFEMVKEVFDDMTSAGGIFYNMQEKQGNTLYGMWAKLGDAASVMYEQIGNTGVVNQGMRLFVQSLTDLMRHWRFWGSMLIWVGGLYALNAGGLKLLRLSIERYSAAGLKNIAVSKARVISAQRELVATRNANVAAKLGANMDLAVAAAKLKAATATNIFSASLYRLWAAFLANPLGWAIAIVGTLVALFYDADDSAKQFAGTLSEIEEKYTLKNLNDADNFKRLADGALKAAAGSKEQRDKLAELDRTYGEILGSENLQIEKLRAMNGEYGSLIETIKEYNIQMKYSEREGAIKEYYGSKKKETFGDFEDELSTIGFGSNEVGHEAGATIAINIQDALLEELEKNGKATVDNANKLLQKQLTNVFIARGRSQRDAELWANAIIERLSSETKDYVEALNSERNALDANSEAAEKASGKLGALRKEIKEAKEELDKINYVDNEGKAIDDDTFLYQQMVANNTMKKAADLISNSQEMKDALGDKAKELEPEWLHLVDSVNPNDLTNITTINFDAILRIIGDKYPDLKRRIKLIQEEWGNVAPTNATALQIRDKLMSVTDSFGLTMDKMKKYLWDGSGDVDAYLKRLKEQQDELKKRLKEKQNTLLQMGKLSKWWNKLAGKDIEAEVAQMEKEIAALDQQIAFTTEYTIPDDKSKGTKSDPRLQNLKEEISLYEKLYQEYKQYEKAVGSSKAAEYMEREAKATIDALAKKYGIGLPKNVTDLTSALEILYKKMQALPSKVFKNLDKELKEFRWKIEKVDIDESQKKIEAQLKALSDRISRTKTAKEFYDKVLGMTGDYELAAKVSISIYGSTGADLRKQLAEQIRQYFHDDEKKFDIEVPVSIIDSSNQINYKRLERFAKSMLDAGKIGADTYEKISKAAQDGQKDLAKTYEGYLKDLEKAKTYAGKRVELARTTAEKIRSIEADIASGNIDEKVGKETIRGLQEKEMLDAGKLEYEAFKETPLYIQMFEDLGQASSTTLEMMKSRLLSLSKVWGIALNPTQLKDLQARINEIDGQLRQRNPFKSLKESYKAYHNALKDMSVEGAIANASEASRDFYETSRDYKPGSAQIKAAEKEFKARQKVVEIAKQLTDEQGKQLKGQDRLNEAQKKAFDNERDARAALDIAAAEEQDAIDQAKAKDPSADPSQDPGVIAAHEKVEAAQAEYETAQRVSEIVNKNAKTSKTLKESWLAAGQAIGNIGNSIRDVGESIASMMEAFGGDADDIQFVKDLSDGLADVFGGVGDIIQSALSGNVMGVITGALSAPLKVFTGIANIFSAGKVRKANKEIKRQQELLDTLSYSYSRLESAIDKALGADYIANYNQRVKNLEAQQRAYMAQAQAERSKGKKADQEKIKEYENAARDVADEIKDMQSELSEYFTGTDVTSAAAEFATSWLEARVAFGNTADAIKDKYKEMIKNMVVQGSAAKVVESLLSPMFDKMDELLKDSDINGATDYLVENMDGFISSADQGLETLYQKLLERGYDMQEILGETNGMTGIARDIASASEESINGLAQGITTQNYYVSYVPQIYEQVAALRALMDGSFSTPNAAMANGWTDWQQQAMDNYMAIQRNTAETVVECRRIAVACEEEVAQLRKAIVPRNTKASHGVAVYIQ